MIRNSILATIVYYDIIDFPLTLIEVHKYLINPGRLGPVRRGIGEIDLGVVSDELDRLVKSRILAGKNGFYFLSGREALYDIRAERERIASQKWKKFLRFSKWLVLNPCLKGFFACGSLALGNTTENSDFDVFVISRSDRLYTCRFFLWLISSLLGVRRRSHENIAPDRFCFNHHITEADMFLKYQSLYTAQLYANLKPVFISPELIDKFFGSNVWINNYLYNFYPQKDFVRRNIVIDRLSRFVSAGLALFFNSSLGDRFESVLKKYQQNKIMRNPLTGQPGGRVVCADTELEFHPHSFESTVIEKYNRGLERLGITPFLKETDSGLIPLEINRPS